jgi:predicted DNA-binding transcriptional regulator AlpA
MTERRTDPQTATIVPGTRPLASSRRAASNAAPRRKPPVRASLQTGAASGPAGAEAEIIAIIAARRGAWSAPDLAELLGCSGKHIYALAKSGRMPHLRIDGMIRFDPGATAAWLRERFIAA